jgi:hypothetical protein
MTLLKPAGRHNGELAQLEKQTTEVAAVVRTVAALRGKTSGQETPELKEAERKLDTLVNQVERAAAEVPVHNRGELKSLTAVRERFNEIAYDLSAASRAQVDATNPQIAQSVPHHFEPDTFGDSTALITHLITLAKEDPAGRAHSAHWSSGSTFVARRGDDVATVLRRSEAFYADDQVAHLWSAGTKIGRRSAVLDRTLPPPKPPLRTTQKLVADLRKSASGADLVREAVAHVTNPEEAALFLRWARANLKELGYGQQPAPLERLRGNLEVLADLNGQTKVWTRQLLADELAVSF